MIQIDMKMPKDCRNCPLAIYLETEELKCTATGQNVYYIPGGERDMVCPLREVMEVKADDVCPDNLELIEPKIPDNVTEKEPVIRVNYLKKDFGALCDTCTQTNKCRWYMLFSAYGLRYIETCDGYQNGGKNEK